MLTSSGGSLNADRGGGKICQNLADVICERSLTSRAVHFDFSSIYKQITSKVKQPFVN